MLNIQIDYASDDSCYIRLWSKGYHEAELFIKACELALLNWDGRKVDLAGVPTKHDYWRTVQADAETKAHGVCDTVRVSSKPGRGAYEVTILSMWLPLNIDKHST